MKATGGLVQAHTLELSAELESSLNLKLQKDFKHYESVYITVEHGLRACSSGLKHEGYDAEEVDVSVVHSEFHKDCLGVHVNPCVVIEILKNSTEEYY